MRNAEKIETWSPIEIVSCSLLIEDACICCYYSYVCCYSSKHGKCELLSIFCNTHVVCYRLIERSFHSSRARTSILHLELCHSIPDTENLILVQARKSAKNIVWSEGKTQKVSQLRNKVEVKMQFFPCFFARFDPLIALIETMPWIDSKQAVKKNIEKRQVK